MPPWVPPRGESPAACSSRVCCSGSWACIVGLGVATLSLPLLLTLAGENLPAALDSAPSIRRCSCSRPRSLWPRGCCSGRCTSSSMRAPRGDDVERRHGAVAHLSRARHRTRNTLVVAQVALALILLVASGLMIRTFQSLRDVDPGFTEPDQIQMLRISIPPSVVPEFPRMVRLQNDIVDRLAAIPGVNLSASRQGMPLLSSSARRAVLAGGQARRRATLARVPVRVARLLRDIGHTDLAGRDFEWADHYGSCASGDHLAEARAARVGRGGGRDRKRLRRSPSNAMDRGDRRRRRHSARRCGPNRAGRHLPDLRRGRRAVREPLPEFPRPQRRVGTPGFSAEIEQAVWS